MKIVCLGGSGGLKRVLKALQLIGLKDVTAVTGVHDSGGDTGKLRKRWSIPPVGDIREIIAELSGEKMLDYRVKNWHKIGNYFLALLTRKYGIKKAVNVFSSLFDIEYKIYPVSNKPTNLFAVTNEGTVEGEHNIERCKKKILKIYIKPEIRASKRVIKTVKNADLVIFSPGSLYTSLLSLLLYKGMKSAVNRAKSRLIISNLTWDDETVFIKTLSSYLYEFEKYGIKDYLVLANSKKIRKFILPDVIGNHIFLRDLVGTDGHDVNKLSQALKEVLKLT